MTRHVFIEERGSKQLSLEEYAIYNVIQERNMSSTFFTKKQIFRRKLPLTKDCYVIGTLPCIYGALKQLQINIPTANSYPESLKEYFHRDIYTSTLGEFQKSFDRAMFVKPSEQEKRFTGRVFYGENDLGSIYNISKRTKIYCSSIVKFISEYRVYIMHSQILSVQHYDGDVQYTIPTYDIEKCIKLLDESGDSHAGYSLDLGILDTGETALIEINDGFSLGLYGDMLAGDYANLLFARWDELIKLSS